MSGYYGSQAWPFLLFAPVKLTQVVPSFYRESMLKRLLPILLCVSAMPALAQVTINEICSKNDNVIDDQFGSSRDWIELYNGGPTDVDLAGWYLSDNDDLYTKWTFPSINLPSNGHIIVFCSGSNIQSPPAHTNFKLSQKGEEVFLSTPNGIPVDSVDTPFLPADWSYGRYQDGADSLVYFSVPTPTTSNGGASFDNYRSATPTFTPSTGYYSGSVMVEIEHPSTNAFITYTLDGTEPEIGSTEYTSPIQVSSNQVIRAKAFEGSIFPSFAGSAGYFFDVDTRLPTVSLIADANALFDPDTGIYVTGPNASPDHPFLGANYWDQVDVPTWFSFIDVDGTVEADQKINIQMHGGPDARTRAMRPFRLLAERDFGKSDFFFKPFEHKGVDEFRRLIVRNSGADFLHTGFRDGLIHNLVLKDRLHLPASGCRPVNVFINGEFFGYYNIREKIDRYYIQDNFGADDDNIDMMGMADGLIEGDSVAYDSTTQFIFNNDMTIEENFQKAGTFFDLLNMVDYFNAEIALNNTDWPNNNLEVWRERSDTGIWRYLFFDLDASMGGVSFVPVDQNALHRALTVIGSTGNEHVAILNKLLTNEEFKRYFINRHLDLLNTSFSTERMLQEIEDFVKVLEYDMPRHFEKWGSTTDMWYESIAIFEERAIERPRYSRDHLRDYFGLSDQHQVSVNIYPAGAGRIDLNSLKLRDFPWSGLYLDGNDIDVEAVATDGYTFSHWEYDGVEISDDQLASLRINPDADMELVAVFEGTDFGPNLQVYPDPIADYFNLSVMIPEAGRVTIDLLDAQGKTVERFMDKNILPGKLNRTYQLASARAGVHVILVRGPGITTAKRVVVLN